MQGVTATSRKISRSWAPRLQNSRNRWAKKWCPTCDRDISNSAIYTTAIYWAYTVFTFKVIPPHWHDTGSWNPSSSKTRTYIFYIVNIMAADDLVTQGARASATMIFILLNQINSVPACWGLTPWLLRDATIIIAQTKISQPFDHKISQKIPLLLPSWK